RILYGVLSQWRMRPTAADGGLTALHELTQAAALGHPFPLILLDAQMPDMDGFTLAQRIKETPELCGATIMMLSSSDLQSDAARSRDLGIAAHLAKPIKQSELLAALLRVLRRDADAAPPRLASATATHDLPPLRILLAEDNAVNQRLMVRILEKHGHH